MFGFSPGKLLLLALVFLVVWYGWKYTRRVDQIRRAQHAEMERRRNAAPGGSGDATRNLPAEDLIKCESCGAYVPAQSAASCGRADCPWR
jgi:uncharacterized protein